ncbi:uncharacterized protein LOC108740466 isoform X2 [Agrilus planipennis]|uniref:Uncharacterized protein LOC108740466 isoform X2 n=1 Tax=Agrilus planipennis TaxID=224129 RepID=A0A1W4XCY6_AGRPL|nr:uncharacterized protein LOC108740466 isoform X2 [Agrilus planipennis]
MIKMEFRQENNHSERNELKVIDNFIYNFESTYGTRHVAFARKPFRHVISESIFSPAETWRVIALYLHHGNDSFAQNWCKNLVSKETVTLLEECFCVLPWDISNPLYHESLKKTLAKNLKNSFYDFFKYQKSGVIFILQLDGIPSVFSILEGNISSETILYTLRNIKEVLRTVSAEFQQSCETYEENQSNIGSDGFQQNMYELLGDRDYDCFEYNQLDELKKKIGFALFGAPQENGYTEKGLQQIDTIFKRIINENMYARYKDQVIISFIFNCTEPLPEEKIKKKEKNTEYNPDGDIGPVPIFVIKKCYSSIRDRGCRIFIDHESRVYTSWSQYINNNRLDKCIMVLPKNGRYRGDENGTVLLEKHKSPACRFGARIVRAADMSASGVGLATGGVLIASAIPAITVAPFVVTGAVAAGAAAGAFSVGRSVMSLIDMNNHKQDVNVIRNEEARNAALNIAAGSIGVLGSGATAVLSEAVSRGVNVGQVGQGVVNTLNVTNLAIGATALGNSMYYVYFSWRNGEEISTLTTLQLATSALFFVNSVYNFRTAATIIEENQTNVLNQIKSDLRSNKHRKMFDKMHKETIRMNGGNRQAGNADVISTIRNIPNKDEIFGILKANNKLFNKKGVKFSASGSKILLNGKALDLGSFSILSKPQRLEVLSEMPATPAPLEVNVTSSASFSIDIINSLSRNDFVNLVSFGARLYTDSTSLNHALQMTLREFSQCIKEKVLAIAMAIVNEAVNIGIDSIQNLLPSVSEPIIVVINVVKTFAQNWAEQYRNEYEESKRRAQGNPYFDADEFDEMYGIHPNTIDKSLYFCEVVIDIMVSKGKVIPIYLEQVFDYFMELITAKLVMDNQDVRREQEQERRYVLQRIQRSCKQCRGHYFVDE